MGENNSVWEREKPLLGGTKPLLGGGGEFQCSPFLYQTLFIITFIIIIIITIIQRASEASEADSQSCSIEISDIYIYIGMYAYVKNVRPRYYLRKLGKAFTVPVFFN